MLPTVSDASPCEREAQEECKTCDYERTPHDAVGLML